MAWITSRVARCRTLSDAPVSAEHLCEEATQSVPADKIGAMSSILGRLAGINLANS